MNQVDELLAVESDHALHHALVSQVYVQQEVQHDSKVNVLAILFSNSEDHVIFEHLIVFAQGIVCSMCIHECSLCFELCPLKTQYNLHFHPVNTEAFFTNCTRKLFVCMFLTLHLNMSC